jgi:teichuronic acid biosynthesis glycosyltransferase TuaC
VAFGKKVNFYARLSSRYAGLGMLGSAMTEALDTTHTPSLEAVGKACQRVVIVTSEWPSCDHPNSGIFVFRQVGALQRAGLHVEVFSFRGDRSVWRYWNHWRALRSLVGKRRYDVVHAQFGQAGFLAVASTRSPVVVTFHGSDLLGLASAAWVERCQSMLLRSMSMVAARFATEVVVVSQQLAGKLAWRRTHVIPVGLDRECFRPMSQVAARDALHWPVGERVVLFVGNPSSSVKRYGLAEQSVANASLELLNLRLRVCWNETPLQVALSMNAADALLVTSAHEGGPLVIREALACNLAVVSVDVGDARARLAKVHGCVVCPDADPKKIATALVQILRTPSRVDGQDALNDLAEDLLTKRMLDVYELAAQTKGTLSRSNHLRR